MPDYGGYYGGGYVQRNEKLARCLRKHRAKRKRKGKR